MKFSYVATSDVTIPPLPGFDNTFTRVLSGGDILLLTGTVEEITRTRAFLDTISGLVAQDSSTYKEWFDRVTAEARVETEALIARDKMAREWLEEHNIPDYVIEYIQYAR